MKILIRDKYSRNERGESELEDCISRLRKMFTNVLGPDKSFFTLGRFSFVRFGLWVGLNFGSV